MPWYLQWKKKKKLYEKKQQIQQHLIISFQICARTFCRHSEYGVPYKCAAAQRATKKKKTTKNQTERYKTN